MRVRVRVRVRVNGRIRASFRSVHFDTTSEQVVVADLAAMHLPGLMATLPGAPGGVDELLMRRVG